MPTSQLSFLKSIAALMSSIGSSLTLHCLLLLCVSSGYLLKLLPSFNISAVVTVAAFVAAAFIDKSHAKLNEPFQFFPHSYKGKLARYFHATLHEVLGVTAVSSNAAV